MFDLEKLNTIKKTCFERIIRDRSEDDKIWIHLDDLEIAFVKMCADNSTIITISEGRTCCNKCGIELYEYDKFCPNCGRQIVREE